MITSVRDNITNPNKSKFIRVNFCNITAESSLDLSGREFPVVPLFNGATLKKDVRTTTPFKKWPGLVFILLTLIHIP